MSYISMTLVKVSDIFDVKYGVNLELINLQERPAKSIDSINFVSRTEKNNGISAFVLRETNITPNQAMTISVAGGGSVLSTFLQKEEYYSGRDVYILTPKKIYTETELLFYVYCIRKNKYRYNYGRQANKTLRDLIIPAKMPAEWKILPLSDYNNLSETPLINNKMLLDLADWKAYRLDDLFDITGSSTTSLLDLELYGRGIHPYVTTQATNNGVDGTYDYFTEQGGVLTVDSAVIGYCSYQPYDFSASDHVEKMIPKFIMNKYIAMFLGTIINLEQYRYNYGRKASQDRLRQSYINLPSDNKGQPDWQYMENYIKCLSYSANL